MDDDRGASVVLSDIRTVAETGSTNADVLALAEAGAPDGLWLRADRQMAGRGRQGRTWQSPVGNLYASNLLRLRPGDPPAPTLALLAGVALDEAVGVFLPAGAGVRLKWPNDLLIGTAKVAGILLERAGDAVVTGIGVNLVYAPVLPDRPTTSLTEWGGEVDPDALLDVLADCHARWLARWRAEGVAPIRTRWIERAHPTGMALTVRLPDEQSVQGLFDGLDPDGALVLRLSSGERRTVHAGDVFLV